MHIMMLENFIIGLFYCLIGILAYKYPQLIAGYNTASAKEKDAYDINTLKSSMRNGFVGIGILSMLLGLLCIFYDNEAVIISIMIALPILLSIGLAFQSMRFRHHTGATQGQRILLWCVMLFGVLILGAVIGMFSHSYTGSIRVNEKDLSIEGPFGISIPYIQMNAVECSDTLPTILLRTRGSAVSHDLRGKFKVKNLGECQLFVRTTVPPFIKIKCTDGGIVYVNCRDSELTTELYQSIQQHLH